MIRTDTDHRRTRRGGFSLIEVVIASVVLAIAVPPALNLLDSAAAGRADAINTTRSAMLATLVLETVTADINSTDANLGFDALATPSVYLETASTGLYDRLAGVSAPYTDAGLSYRVQIGEVVGVDGTASADPDANVFRVVTVVVEFPGASSSSYRVPVSTMVSAL